MQQVQRKERQRRNKKWQEHLTEIKNLNQVPDIPQWHLLPLPKSHIHSNYSKVVQNKVCTLLWEGETITHSKTSSGGGPKPPNNSVHYSRYWSHVKNTCWILVVQELDFQIVYQRSAVRSATCLYVRVKDTHASVSH